MRAFIAGSLLALAGCSTAVPAGYYLLDSAYAPPPAVDLRIGLVADSQFQTARSGDYVPLLKGKLEDRFVNVAVRPPALDDLSHSLLTQMLRRLHLDRHVDVVLYLGDAANNGCQDELRGVFSLLREFRKWSGVPVFFVIGNHDYLGAGNTSFMSDRRPLCDREARDAVGRNLPVSKFELIRMAGVFNSENPELTAWRYKDSWLGREQEIFDACVANLPAAKVDKDPQHKQLGCYFAGRLSRDVAGRRVEILLTDTSDYHDKGFLYGVLGKQFLGISGWISTVDEPDAPPSQARWFEIHRDTDPPTLRFIASHYPPDALGILSKWLPWPGVMARIGGMLLPEPEAGNYWLYAHKHHFDDPRDFEARIDGKEVAMRLIGVGSTTDHGRSQNELPHALVLTVADDGNFSFDLLPAQVECDDVIDAVDALTRVVEEGEAYRPVKDRFRGAALLGMDRSYRDANWIAADKENALVNLHRYLEHLEAEGMDPYRAKLCLALEASRREKFD